MTEYALAPEVERENGAAVIPLFAFSAARRSSGTPAPTFRPPQLPQVLLPAFVGNRAIYLSVSVV